MTIVTYAHRPKRARKRKAQAAAIAVPTIVTAKSKRTSAGCRALRPAEPATIVTAKNPLTRQVRRRARHDAGGAQATRRCRGRALVAS